MRCATCGHKRERHGPGKKSACWKGGCKCEQYVAPHERSGDVGGQA